MFNKWILGGVAFLIVFSVACILWYQHGTAPYRQDAAKSEQLLRQSEIAQKVADTDSEGASSRVCLLCGKQNTKHRENDNRGNSLRSNE